MINVEYTSDRVNIVRSQWGYKGTAYGCMNCGFGVTVPIYNYCPNCGARMGEDVAGKTAPDLVAVVRCRDCKHRPTDNRDMDDMTGFAIEFPDGKCPCQCEDGWYNWYPGDDWFCANGERREDE